MPMCYRGACVLVCEGRATCPTGMYCDEEASWEPFVPTCGWLVDSTSRGCPAYCKLDPVPRDCPNWCAAIGVACDSSKHIDCCAGLTCGAQHFCEAMK